MPQDDDPLGDTDAADVGSARTMATPAGARAGTGLVVGANLGDRYSVTALLGGGGMGQVYLALDRVLGLEVALKLVEGSADAMERLKKEVLLAQRVTHRNVCRTHDLEEVDGRHVVKMEYVRGETLGRYSARQGPLPVAETLRIAREVTAGLAAAHAAGVIHRDLKPDNIQLEADTGRVVLTDFGIALLEKDGAEDIAGTPAYMAPELSRGDDVDARTDLYALGCVLHVLLIGEIPFPARTPKDAAKRHLEDPPPELRARRKDVPPWLAALVARLLAKDPSHRPPSAERVLEALAGPRRLLLRVLAAGAALAIVVGGVWLARPREWRAETRPLPAYDENGDVPAISADGTRLAYLSDRERAGWFRVYVGSLDGGADRAVTRPDLNLSRVTWDRRGDLLLVDVGAVAWRQSLDGATAKIGDGINDVVECGDQLLLSDRTGHRYVLRAGDGTEREVLSLPPGQIGWRARCDREGRRMVHVRRGERRTAIHSASDIWLVDLTTTVSRNLTRDGMENLEPTFHPRGDRVIFSSGRGGKINLWEVPAIGGKPTQLTFGGGDDHLGGVTPDGRQLVFLVDVTSAQLFARVAGARRKITSARQILLNLTVVPRSGEVIASATAGNRSEILAISPADGTQRVLAQGSLPALSAATDEVLFVGGERELWAVPRTGGPPRRVAVVDGDVSWLHVGPDGLAHLSVTRVGGQFAETVPVAGGTPTVEAPPPICAVLPAPRGGWRLVRLCPGGFQLVAPGAPIDPAAKAFEARGVAWDASGESYLAYAGAQRLTRTAVATGVVTVVIDGLFGEAFACSPDGATLYTSEIVSHVSRHLITNFGDRR